MAPNYGYQASIAIGDALPVTQRIDFISETFSLKQEMPYLGGMRGVRARNINRVREGIRRVDGNIVCQPTALEWSYLLPWILGGAAVGTSYPISETVPGKYIMKDMGSKVYTYDHCRVSKCTIACQQGETLKVTLDVAGVDEVPGNSGTFPVLTLDATTTPFMFFDVVLTFGGTTYIIKDLEFSIDNVLDTERFFSSKTLSPDAGATDRMVCQSRCGSTGTRRMVTPTPCSPRVSLASRRPLSSPTAQPSSVSFSARSASRRSVRRSKGAAKSCFQCVGFVTPLVLPLKSPAP